RAERRAVGGPAPGAPPPATALDSGPILVDLPAHDGVLDIARRLYAAGAVRSPVRFVPLAGVGGSPGHSPGPSPCPAPCTRRGRAGAAWASCSWPAYVAARASSRPASTRWPAG